VATYTEAMNGPQKCTLLTYDYVPDMQERRTPHREEHLALIAAWKAEGRILLAGAMGDPPRALFVFANEQDAPAFMDADPYAQNDLVKQHHIEPLIVV
jgi:uncharacterized protein YciI